MSEIVYQLVLEEKKKYQVKALSSSAEDIIYIRILDVHNILTKNTWLLTMISLMSAFAFSVLYNIPPYLVEPVSVEFDADTPYIEIKVPKWLIDEVCFKAKSPEEALAILPHDIKVKILSIIPPGMDYRDALRIFCSLFTPEALLTLPEEVKAKVPNLRAWYYGVRLVVKKRDVTKDWPWLASVEAFQDTNFKYRLTGLEKCVYGISRYSYCYVDPNIWQALLTGSLTRLFIHYRTMQSLKHAVDVFGDVGEININILYGLVNRLSLLTALEEQCFVLGYGILGVTPLCKRCEDQGEVEIVTADGREVKVRLRSLDEAQYAFILDITPLDQGILLPEPTIYKTVERQLPGDVLPWHRTRGGPPVEQMVEHRARKMIRQSLLTSITLTNYQRWEEMRGEEHSELMEAWAAIQQLYAMIDRLVEPILEKHKLSQWDKRVYKNAVRQLIGFAAKRHHWGFKVFKVLRDEEFRRWWLDYWTKQGLNSVILEELYNVVKEWLPHLRLVKEELGKRVKQRRYQLANLPSP